MKLKTLCPIKKRIENKILKLSDSQCLLIKGWFNKFNLRLDYHYDILTGKYTNKILYKDLLNSLFIKSEVEFLFYFDAIDYIRINIDYENNKELLNNLEEISHCFLDGIFFYEKIDFQIDRGIRYQWLKKLSYGSKRN